MRDGDAIIVIRELNSGGQKAKEIGVAVLCLVALLAPSPLAPPDSLPLPVSLVDLDSHTQPFFHDILARDLHWAAHATAVHPSLQLRIPKRLVPAVPQDGGNLSEAGSADERRHLRDVAFVQEYMSRLHEPNFPRKPHSFPGLRLTPMPELLGVGQALKAQYFFC
jgi:hypothetical protein